MANAIISLDGSGMEPSESKFSPASKLTGLMDLELGCGLSPTQGLICAAAEVDVEDGEAIMTESLISEIRQIGH